jgi:beta-glucanase (GH16 family)
VTLLLQIGCIKENKKSEEIVESPQFYDEFDYENTPGGYSWRDEWSRATWMMNSTQMGEERAYPENGVMNFIVTAGEPYEGGAIQTRNQFLYGRWEAFLKPADVPGVVNAMFTNDWDNEYTEESNSDGTHQEIDIEFLPYTFGENTGQVHIALHDQNHVNYLNEDINLDFNPSDGFHVWGFEILPDKVSWFVDEAELHTFYYNSDYRINATYQFFFNAWTSNSNWVKGPPETDALFQVEWVKFYPYN